MTLVVVYGYEFIFKYTMSNAVSCLLSVILGIIVYMTSIMCMRVFDVEDVKSRFSKK